MLSKTKNTSRTRKNFYIVPVILGLAATALAIFFNYNEFVNLINNKKPIAENGTIAILTGMAVGTVIYALSYLPKFLSKNGISIADDFPISESIIDFILRKYLKGDLNSIDVEKKVENKTNKIRFLRRRKLKQALPNPLNEYLDPLESNIKNHIIKLQNNSIVNLMIGIIGTIISITVLSFSLISTARFTELQQFLLNFVPRISFVIFIQLFAFFFLRLYRGNLEDSKYFQNELTNIMAKCAALRIAFKQENNELIKNLVEDLSKVERNFKLAAGESLLNIEKTKIEKEYDIEILNFAKELIKAPREK